MELQHTIAGPIALSGRGLFGGQEVTARFEPAPADHGVVFVRADQGATEIPAHVDHVIQHERRTSLRNGDAVVETCEHCLSALAGLRIDNIAVHLDGPELPGMDGSARPFLQALSEAGVVATDGAPRHWFRIQEPLVIRNGEASLTALPSEEEGLHVVYDLDYGPSAAIERQVLAYDVAREDYARDLAPARTFLLEAEAQALHSAGVGMHLTPRDVLVIGDNGPLDNSYRLEHEPVRHKVMDLIGDLFLIGAPLQGRILARKSGHALNHALVQALLARRRAELHRDLLRSGSRVDIRALMRMLPHRYPMLLVDRVLEIDADRRILGVKNVTINEPFFQGHYPGTPIMPGVLVVEAMAQLSGVLIGQSLEHTGKLAVLLSLDRVKLRKPVTPGDQLLLEAESIRVRSRIAHMRCRAFIGDDIAAEAEIRYMLVDNEDE